MVATRHRHDAAPSPASVLGSRPAHECVVWVVSPAGYAHAHAFDEVADALAEGLATALGGAPEAVPVVRDPTDIAGRTTVVVGANLLSAETAHLLPGSSLIVNLEQLDASSRWFGEPYRSLLERHAVIDYSERNTAALHRLGLGHVRHLSLGAGPGLVTVPTQRTDHVDVCFYGSVNPRRQALLDELERRGLIVERLFGVYGTARDAAIARAKLVLNVHYYDAAVFEAVRVNHLLANRVCVVTEGDDDDPDLAMLRGGLAIGRYDELADRCEELAADESARRTLADAGFVAMNRRPLGESWRRALDLDTTPDTSPVTLPTADRQAGRWRVARAPVRRVTVLAGGDTHRRHSLTIVAGELAALGVDVRAAVIDHPDQVARRGWDCTVQAGHRLGDHAPVERFTHARDHMVLAADSVGAALATLAPLRRALWWLSVDDLVGPGGSLADPSLRRALVEDTGIEHYHHGAYVREFLRSEGIATRRLDDHLGPVDVAIHQGTKVIVGPHCAAADQLAAALAPLEVELLANDRSDATRQLLECGVYVHAGPLCGRDLTLRLAVATGALVFVPDVGAGRYVEDVPVPDDRRYDDPAVRSGDLAERIRLALAVPDVHHRAQEPYRWAVEDERSAMVRQLTRLVGAPGDY